MSFLLDATGINFVYLSFYLLRFVSNFLSKYAMSLWVFTFGHEKKGIKEQRLMQSIIHMFAYKCIRPLKITINRLGVRGIENQENVETSARMEII